MACNSSSAETLAPESTVDCPVYPWESLCLLDEMEELVKVCNHDPKNMRNIWGNTAFLNKLGLTQEQIFKQDLSASPQMAAWNKEIYLAVQVGLQKVKKRRTVYPKSGPLTLDIHYKPVRLKMPSGEITEPLCLITMVALSDSAHEDDANRSHALLNYSADCMTLCTLKGTGIYANLAAKIWYKIKDGSPNSARAASLDRIFGSFHWDSEEEMLATKQRVMSMKVGDEPVLLDLSFTPPDSGVLQWRSVSCTWTTDPATGVECILVVEHDISYLKNATQALIVEKERYEEILYSMLPGPLCSALKTGAWSQGHRHKSISLLMTDVVGFKTICQHTDPSVVMTLLDDLYTLFDSLVFHFSSLVKTESLSDQSLTKIESFSDHYVACGGLHFNTSDSSEPSSSEEAQEEHLEMLLTLAMAMVEATLHVASPLNQSRITIRVGIHTGPCTSGFVGVSLPRLNLFGELVQHTHELEVSSLPGIVQVSQAVVEKLGPRGVKFSPGQCYEGVSKEGVLQGYFVKSIPEESRQLVKEAVQEAVSELSSLRAYRAFALRKPSSSGDAAGDADGLDSAQVMSQRSGNSTREIGAQRTSVGVGKDRHTLFARSQSSSAESLSREWLEHKESSISTRLLMTQLQDGRVFRP